MAVQPVGEYNPRELEERILKHWKANKIPEKTIHPVEGRPQFSFLEGPPTANAPPALHHVEVRVFKDLVNRYHYMKGFSVPRKAGWDCHGLPVEVQVEKELKLNSKKEILSYGLDRFIEKCRASVFTHIKEWDAMTDRMAYWIDLEKPYVTMDNDYIESVWWSLKELWGKKLLYEGHKVVPYCSRCGTPLSSHEVALGYRTVKEQTVVVKFQAKDKDYSFLAWTTTPWTLLSNVALAVNPEIKYVTIKYRGEKYVLAKERLGSLEGSCEILEERSGKDLAGIEYHPLFSHFIGKLDAPAWRIITGGFVSTEEGTGIVHIAPAFGEDDYNVGLANNLPLINPLDEDGKFTSKIPELAGMFAKDADPRIITILDEMGALFTQYPYEHEYPYCWRCGTPLLYYAMESWFIKVTDVVPKLLEKNNTINWYPEHIKTGRFGNWLENAKDWSLSRNRFWGTPLPLWECTSCKNREMLGSRKELAEKALKNPGDVDLHRPYIDSVRLKCQCGGTMQRVPYVIDCWYDSGAATFAQFHYPFENQKLFRESHPYDFISEATDQTRGWFYTLLVISTILFDAPAYKNCVVGGLLLDDNGEKMSKSKNNIVDPWELFNTVGVDAVRLQMCSSAPWNARRFGTESLNESVVPLLRTLWNCYSFSVRYMLLDNFDPRDHALDEKTLQTEDSWIISKANTLVQDVSAAIDANEYHLAVERINNFTVEDLSRWYIKIIRDRLWLEDGKSMNPSKKAAYLTLHRVFEKLGIALAPIAPYTAEELYQNLAKKPGMPESIHLQEWPTPERQDKKLEERMDVARKIFEAGSSCRQAADIKLRHPIQKATIAGDRTVEETVKALQDILAKQLNAREVEFIEELPGITYIASPNYAVLGPAYGKKAPLAAEAIRSNGKAVKKAVELSENITLNNFEITPAMVGEIRINVPAKYAAAEFSAGKSMGVVYIEKERSQSLLNEALARDVIRNVQELRKKHNLAELQKVKVLISSSPAVERMLAEYKDAILKEVRASEIMTAAGMKAGISFEFQNEAVQVEISF
ncbi:MAG: isoleucine--tRNA ligase [Candidatus Altiarchaeota archaeon]|nr:isoleucine--tRNA ligase [Candidatus Altiarchaeota archaeon]